MSFYSIEIDDSKIMEQIQTILNQIFETQMRRKYSGVDEVIREAAKEIVYSRKDEIIDKVVDRATREIVKKGLPKLIERMNDNE